MKLKIALLQMCPKEEEIQANMRIADAFCRQAAREGAHLAIFPEMFSVGYPTPYNESNSFEDWKAVAFEERAPDSKKLIDKYRRLAIDDGHEYIRYFRRLAEDLRMAIAVTYMSRGKEFPRNTVLLIDRHGHDVLKYSKTHLFAPFFIDAICEPGEGYFVRELDTQVGLVKLGALICADRNIPEPSRVLMKLGAEIVIIPNSCPLKGLGGILLDAVKIRAFENAMVVMICNYPEPKNDGYSAAFGPDGALVFRADSSEGIYMVEYDLEALRAYRERAVEGDSFREECLFESVLGGEVKPPFSDRLNALGERPARYSLRRETVGHIEGVARSSEGGAKQEDGDSSDPPHVAGL